MANLVLRDIRKSFQSTDILRGINLDVPEGSFVALVGPSGCGKSTLLRLIAGLEKVSAGRIEVGGRLVNHLGPRARNIAMVFQSYALYPHLDVARNMSFALELRRTPKAEIATKVAHAAEILGLGQLLDRYPRELSGGQRQRVAMGRAIVRDPDLFLFDEPLSNLDANLRVHMRSEIKALHQRLGKTTVYVTHDQVEAMTMADHVVVMRQGLVEQSGRPLDLYDHPANQFVAGFLGSPAMNFLSGRIADAGASVETGGWKTNLPAKVGLADGTPVTVGIRPERLFIDASGEAMTVDLVEPTGSETLVQGEIGGQRLRAAFRERLNLKSGEILKVAVAPENIHLFAVDAGDRIA